MSTDESFWRRVRTVALLSAGAGTLLAAVILLRPPSAMGYVLLVGVAPGLLALASGLLLAVAYGSRPGGGGGGGAGANGPSPAGPGGGEPVDWSAWESEFGPAPPAVVSKR